MDMVFLIFQGCTAKKRTITTRPMRGTLPWFISSSRSLDIYKSIHKDRWLTLFQEPTIFQFQRSLRMTAIDFISQIGGNAGLLLVHTTQYWPLIGPHYPILASDWLLCPGLLGLFLGFSLISGFELLYWFTLRLGQRLCCQPRHTWAADAL